MKIAIFFLLVGLCSCGDFSDPCGSCSETCSGSITLCQAETAVRIFCMMARKYDRSRGKPLNKVDKVCLVDLTSELLDFIAGCMNCKRSYLIGLVLQCLNVVREKKVIIGKALTDRNPLLVKDIEVEDEKITKAVYCFLGNLMGQNVVANLIITVYSVLDPVLGTLGLNSLFYSVGGILNIKFTRLPNPVNNILYSATTVLGQALPAVGGVITITGAVVEGVTSAIGNLLGGLVPSG